MRAAGRGQTSRRVQMFARAVVVALVAIAAAGCGSFANGVSHVSARSIRTVRIDEPVVSLVWDDETNTVFGLTPDGRVERIHPSRDGGSAHSRLSQRMPDVGDDVAISTTTRDRVYVPRPARGRITVLDAISLRRVGSLNAGSDPTKVAIDPSFEALLALSADGSSVTPVHLPDQRTLPTAHVNGGPRAQIEAAGRGSYIAYHVISPRGISHYQGNGDVSQRGEIALATAGASAGDRVKVSRVYTTTRSGRRVVAVDVSRYLDGLEVVGHADVDQRTQFLDTDALRIYAAAQNKIVVLATRSFTGYQRGHITRVATIRFRSALPPLVRHARVAGMVVGDHRIWLSFVHQPFVASIPKPAL